MVVYWDDRRCGCAIASSPTIMVGLGLVSRRANHANVVAATDYVEYNDDDHGSVDHQQHPF